MNFIIDTQSKTITIKESYKLYDMVTELEKRFTKEELKDYVIIPGIPSLINPWGTTLGGPNVKDMKIGPPYGAHPFTGTGEPTPYPFTVTMDANVLGISTEGK